jgi:predicted RNA polymerase sigma factor
VKATDTLVEVLRSEGLRVLAALARTIGDLAVAEDALSEATISALDTWPRTGIPDNPRAWLAVVARRKALDLLRRESARAAKETAASGGEPGPHRARSRRWNQRPPWPRERGGRRTSHRG